MVTKEKALQEKEGKKTNNNTVNGTGGTPIHVNTLQVRLCDLWIWMRRTNPDYGSVYNYSVAETPFIV